MAVPDPRGRDGITTAGGHRRKFRAPNGYVPFEEKLEALRSRTDWVEPPSWVNGKPTAADWALIAKYPPAVDDMGDTSNGTIQGSSWYGVVILTLNPKCHLAQDLNIDAVAICFEQFARTHEKKFVAWPFDQLDAKVVDSTEVPAEERRHAPWRLLKEDEDEFVTLGKGYSCSDYGDDGSPEDGSSPWSEKPVW